MIQENYSGSSELQLYDENSTEFKKPKILIVDESSYVRFGIKGILD